jgi:hypothetical protein
MKACCWLLFGLFWLATDACHAEGNCPPGYYPIGAPQGQAGPQGCAPIPGYGSNPQQENTQSPPPPQWASRWGAVATDAAKGILGAAANATGKEEAQQTAIADCQANGGTQCILQNTYGNACVAVITGDKVFNVGSSTDLNDAIQSGITQCSSADTNCHVYYSACSLPVQIQ